MALENIFLLSQAATVLFLPFFNFWFAWPREDNHKVPMRSDPQSKVLRAWRKTKRKEHGLHGVVVLPVLLDGDIGEVNERIIQFLYVARVLGRAESRKAVDVKIHSERP